MPVADSLTYVSKIAEKNRITGRTQGIAIAILADAKRKRFAAGKDPMGLAAAALYIACLQNNEKITQKDIADASGVTEVTVRNRYKALTRQLSLKIPEKEQKTSIITTRRTQCGSSVPACAIVSGQESNSRRNFSFYKPLHC